VEKHTNQNKKIKKKPFGFAGALVWFDSNEPISFVTLIRLCKNASLPSKFHPFNLYDG